MLLTACPPGEAAAPDASAPRSLGAACECPGGEDRCGPFDPCTEGTDACPPCDSGLECVAALCSAECDPYLDDCPEGFVCGRAVAPGTTEILDGYWCLPPPRCLAEAGTDGASLMMAEEPVGEPCAPPAGGEASISGTAFMVPYPTPQGALFPDLDEEGREATLIQIGPVEEILGLPPGQCGIDGATLLIRLPCSAARLGSHPVGPDFEGGEVEVELDIFGVGGRAVSGTLTLDGYDPFTLSLCGSVDAYFDDTNDGRLSGTFGGRGLCGGP